MQGNLTALLITAIIVLTVVCIGFLAEETNPHALLWKNGLSAADVSAVFSSGF